MRQTSCMIGLCGVLLAIVGPVAAEVPDKGCGLCDAAESSSSYVTQAGGKLGRGLVNAFFGWTELFVQPARAHRAHEDLATGIDRGIGNTIKRTIVGIGEFFTFWTWPGTPRWAQDCALGTMGITGR